MRILFLTPGMEGRFAGTERLAPFQQADLDALRSLGHEVRLLVWKGRPVLRVLRESRRTDAVYCWGIGQHAFWSSWFARRLLCVVGGYEFASLPELGYGNMIRWDLRAITRRVWSRADALLYVDPSLEAEAAQAFGHPGRAHTLPTGYDASFWTPGPGPRENLAVTVCHAPTVNRWKVKGVDLFLDVARRMPEVQFVVAGEIPHDAAVHPLPSNVRLAGWMEAEALRDLYRRAAVYCQFSLHEGLPNAVCEAMLCGTVPVGMAVNGIPTAIGDAGFVVDRDPGAIRAAILEALGREDLGRKARERIMKTFSRERRVEGLRRILDGLAGKS